MDNRTEDNSTRFAGHKKDKMSPNASSELVAAVQALSHARDLDTITSIVSSYARKLTGADGASIILKDRDRCYYADEDSIAPLWKGRRFPMTSCVSGWSMMNRQAVKIKDIYQDSRVPTDAYRPTFVKSLLIVPIRKSSPIGAIGNYWATHHEFTDDEQELLQALADSTSIALENVELYSQLQDRIKDLQESNYELGRYSWIASHDLREPLRTITTYLQLVEKQYLDDFDVEGKQYITFAVSAARRLQRLITDISTHSNLSDKSADFFMVDTSAVVEEVLKSLSFQIQQSKAQITKGNLPVVRTSTAFLTQIFNALISNAIKFRSPNRALNIKIGAEPNGSDWIFYIKDNAIGIDRHFHDKIFGMFQRLHPQDQYEGSGLGLAICKRIIELHKGKIWVESTLDKGSSFYFTFPASIPSMEINMPEDLKINKLEGSISV